MAEISEDASEEVIGWRAWTLLKGGLGSISNILWEPEKPLRARCYPEKSGVLRPGTPNWVGTPAPTVLGSRVPQHGAVPEPGCTCGIYAWDTARALTDDLRVIGAVKLWGRIIHGEGQYRAEFAYPYALFVPRAMVGQFHRRALLRALDAYNVPVKVIDSLSELVDDAPPHCHVHTATQWAPNPMLLETVLSRSSNVASRVHGMDHWRRVTVTGIKLANETLAADAEVVAAFGILHDSLRLADRGDRAHGLRAALLAFELRDDGVIHFDDGQMHRLGYALQHHNCARVSTDPTIGCAWDADRLDLTRVGIRPRFDLLSTEAGRRLLQR